MGAARVIPDRQERGPKSASKVFSKFEKFFTGQQKQVKSFLHLRSFDGKENGSGARELLTAPKRFRQKSVTGRRERAMVVAAARVADNHHGCSGRLLWCPRQIPFVLRVVHDIRVVYSERVAPE